MGMEIVMEMGMEMVREVRGGGGGGWGGGELGEVGEVREVGEGGGDGGGGGGAGRRVGGSEVSAWTVYSAFVVRGSKGRLSGESAAYVWRNPLVGYGVD
jgi:hypothetical protein